MQPRANIDRLAGKRITEVDDYRSADALLVEARCLLGSAVPDGGAVIVGRPRDMTCLLYTSPSPRDLSTSRMPSSA